MMSPSILLGEIALTLDHIVAVARHHRSITLSVTARERMQVSRAVVAQILAKGDAAPPVYGINTGFGAMAEVRIDPMDIAALQKNLLRSHAAGVGTPLPTDVVRAMVLLRAAVLAQGHSGTRPEVAELLCALLNCGIHPVIPSRGSVGASGDLAPLAHLALVLIGEGHAEYQDEVLPGGEALLRAGLVPLSLQAKEGLALVNGTQLMTACGALAIYDAQVTSKIADIVGALSLEAHKGSPAPFDARIHAARPHPGQIVSARNVSRLLDAERSGIITSHKHCKRVQDPYSFRCIAQVHGATRDALHYARHVLECEANGSTDNPLIFADGDEPSILSGGNFHGQPVALALDFAAIAVAEVGSISERRIDQLLNTASTGLPPFLASQTGLHSGFMLAHVTAAALVSENKILAHPASVDSIPTSAGREDHVSMGTHAALKLVQIHDHVRTVLAIELLVAAQALDLRLPLTPAPVLQAVHRKMRSVVPPMLTDRVIAPDIAAVRGLIDDGTLLATVEPLLGSPLE